MSKQRIKLTSRQALARARLIQRIDALIAQRIGAVSLTYIAERSLEGDPFMSLSRAIAASMLSGTMSIVRQRLAQQGYVGPAEPEDLLRRVRSEMLRVGKEDVESATAAISSRILRHSDLPQDFICAVVSHELRSRDDGVFRAVRDLHTCTDVSPADRPKAAKLSLVIED
ncbi:hypothetical protein [Variovorax rhizosphaerae]|uniref:Uncharacterized protein n=1 Tax=Variovorax rhizosphaerae TaxID=1836200 RepID=A0ABU8WXH6_9BURK